MVERGPGKGEIGADEVASYVASMATELKSMVERHNLPALSYLLELVRMEAEARAADAQRFAGRRSS